MELANTPRDQVQGLTRFLYGQTRASQANPAPAIPDWVGGNAANIRTAHRALDLHVEGLEADQLNVTLADLVTYSRQFGRLPNLTRIILSELDTWLTHADRQTKSDRIAAAYPNEEGLAGGVDIFVSVCTFIKDVQLGGEMMVKRLLDGEFWVSSYDKMRAELSEVRTLVPKVQLRKAEPSQLVTQAEKLIASQEQFWNAYKAWLDCS